MKEEAEEEEKEKEETSCMTVDKKRHDIWIQVRKYNYQCTIDHTYAYMYLTTFV
jgi:hypothetical protein